MKHLANLLMLEDLTLNSSKVTDDSLDVLASLTNLRKLNLAGTKLTAAGKEKLSRLLPKTAIAY